MHQNINIKLTNHFTAFDMYIVCYLCFNILEENKKLFNFFYLYIASFFINIYNHLSKIYHLES